MKNPPLPPVVQSVDEIASVWKENRTDLVRLLAGIPEEDFQTRPPSGGWSPSEVAEHLYLSQNNLARSIPIVMAGKFGKDRSEFNENPPYDKIFNMVSKARGVKNPVEVGPKGGMDKVTTLSSLEKSEQKLFKGTSGQSVESLRSRGMDHPFFGPISMLDWIWVMTNHEFAHINALKEKYTNA